MTQEDSGEPGPEPTLEPSPRFMQLQCSIPGPKEKDRVTSTAVGAGRCGQCSGTLNLSEDLMNRQS